MRARAVLAAVLLSLGLAAAPASAQHGQISGRISNAADLGLAGVRVSIAGHEATATTDASGTFTVRLPSGSYDLTFRAGDRSETVSAVAVEVNETTWLDEVLDWDLSVGEGTAVSSAAGRTERLVSSGSAMTIADSVAITTEAAHGQLPRLLEFGLGVELTTSGLFDFTVNSRGTNRLLNSRVGVRIDGRDASMLFFGGQEWAAIALPLDDAAQVEMIRGPSSSIYGSDSANGTVSVITRSSRAGGGQVRVAGGEEGTLNGDLVFAPRLGDSAGFKLLGSHRTADLTSVSRTAGSEYSARCTALFQANCLPAENAPLADSSADATNGSLRFDWNLAKGGLLSFEGGFADASGDVLLTDLGRIQVLDSSWTWARAGFSALHWDFRYSYRERKADRQRSLATGDDLVLDETSWSFDLKTDWQLSERLSFLAGLYTEDEDVATATFADNGAFPRSRFNLASRRGSLLLNPISEDAQAAYAQLDWHASDRVRLVVGARFDDGSYFEPQWSPRLALIYEVTPGDSFRLSFSQGFRAPTYEELYLQFDAANGVNLAVLEPACRLHGTQCGFDLDNDITATGAPNDPVPDTRQLLLGNANLVVEETETIEIGYRGDLGRSAFLDISYHVTDHDNLIAGPLPQVGTSVGPINPDYQPYELPVEIPSELPPDPDNEDPRITRGEIDQQLRNLLGPLYPFLSGNLLDNTPLIALGSYANVGSVEIQGADLGLDVGFSGAWSFELNYSWLDADGGSAPFDLREYVLPNAPSNRAAVGISYRGERFDLSVRGRWVDDFRFVSGPFRGNVDSYTTADLFANVAVSDHVSLGANVANVLDEEHFQIYGGDLLGRRALATLTVTW